jgi:excisionase family DNA binding protein
MADKAYLSVEEVAERFGVTPSTIYRLAQRGALPGFKVGGQWRFSALLLDSWAADQMITERWKTNGDADAPDQGKSAS